MLDLLMDELSAHVEGRGQSLELFTVYSTVACEKRHKVGASARLVWLHNAEQLNGAITSERYIAPESLVLW